MADSTARKKFKKVIHPNRHFIWAISVLVISGLALSAFIYITSSQEDFSSVFPFLLQRKTFISASQHYAVSYPKNWQLEKDQSGNVIFENPDNANESISVALTSPDMEGVIRSAIQVQSERDFTTAD